MLKSLRNLWSSDIDITIIMWEIWESWQSKNTFESCSTLCTMLGWFKKIIIVRGKWNTFAHWFQIFFSGTYGWFLISDQSFQKSKGGPLDEKNLKKIDFYVWYLKRTALKNVDWKWNRFLKILIFVEVMD